MGAWGAKLYEDDEALDLRDTLSSLTKMPVSGDKLLSILLDNYEGETNLDVDGGAVFWLVVADQFEKKGIRCEQAFDMAIKAIKSGSDLLGLENRGMDAKGIKERKKVLDNLLDRFENPRPEKLQKTNIKLPPFEVEIGDIYCFPTMKGEGFNAWGTSWEQYEHMKFIPNG